MLIFRAWATCAIIALKHIDLSQYLQFSLLQPHLETKVDRRRTQEIVVKLLLPLTIAIILRGKEQTMK